jgi:hypothetical protein
MKEENFIINTESGLVRLEIPNVIGKLDCIILDTKNKIEIDIDSKKGYKIFNRKEHVGVVYYPVRVRTVAVSNTDIQSLLDIQEFEKFNLNESLVITIIGIKNDNVNIILRFE